MQDIQTNEMLNLWIIYIYNLDNLISFEDEEMDE